MERRSIIAALGAILTFSAGLADGQQAPPPRNAPRMYLSSTSFTDGGVIPDKYTQASDKPVSPAIAWSNVPAATASLTMIFHDLDGNGRDNPDSVYWMMFNIPPSTSGLTEGQPPSSLLPDGSIQVKQGNRVGFFGPGTRGELYHHYIFEVYALNIKLPLGGDATRDQIMQAMEGHFIGKAAYGARFTH